MTITGLNSDLYFADNPIYITFSGINPNTNYIQYFVTGSTIKPSRLYTNGRESISVDISQLVKLMFPEIPHNTNYTTLTPFVLANNWANVSFVVNEVYKSGLTSAPFNFTKTYVSGGFRSNDPNQHTSVNTPLTPNSIGIGLGGYSTEFKIPQWGGYPIDYFYFNGNKQMEKSNVIPPNIREYRNIKGCDPLYFKFKNSKGGYSYWLFENSETYHKNRNLGIVQRMRGFVDLGNTPDTGVEVTSKVPKRFFRYMVDLTDSKEIYIYLGNNKWEQVTSDNNTVKQNKFNTNEKVKLKFAKHHRFNPTRIW